MIRHGFEVRAALMPWSQFDIGVYLARYADDRDIGHQPGTLLVATEIIFDAIPRGLPRDPEVRIDRHGAQALMDDLWNAGLRPTQGRQSEGVVDAQAAHLADMRALAFAKLGVAAPGIVHIDGGHDGR